MILRYKIQSLYITIERTNFLKYFFYFLAICLFLNSCTSQIRKQSKELEKEFIEIPKNQFIMVNGNHFEYSGKPYYFVGTNLWYAANLGALSKSGDQQRLLDELDLLKSMNINNLRILGGSEGNLHSNTVNPTSQPKSGQYDENILKGLDFVLSEMKERDMFAVIYLNNFWEWSGGMARYVTWEQGIPFPNPWFDDFGWGNFMNLSASMYSNPEAIQAYYNYIELIINRENSYTGIKYKNDPTIMAWQLANEPRPGSGEQGIKNSQAFSQWVKETSSFIKSLDSNHLVSVGSEGIVGTNGSTDLYEEIHKFEEIDYLTFHLWVYNWNWFDPLKPEETYQPAETKAREYIEEHIQIADMINKPIVFEEFGIPRDGHSYARESTTQWRDRYYEFIFDKIYQNASKGGPLMGSNFWAWGGFGKARETESAIWKYGDDYTGDPPHEPQGRNSVFASDSTTLKILKKYSELMQNIKIN